MSKTLDAVRAKYPQYAGVSDDDLVVALAAKAPVYLERDPDFQAEYSRAASARQPAVREGANRLPSQDSLATYGGPAKPVPTYRQGMEALGDEIPALGAAGQAVARGGKTLLAGMADLATLYPGGPEPSVENLASYAANPEASLPVEQDLAEMRGWGGVPSKMAAGMIRATPAIGASVALGMAGVPAPLAAAIPLSADETGTPDPFGAAVALGLPAAARAGEAAMTGVLAKMPVKEVVVESLRQSPQVLSGRVVQQFGPMQISDDMVRQWLETGGGAVTANAYLAAAQAPQLMDLPEGERGQAILDMIAANVGPSLLGFASRQPMSRSLTELYPQVSAKIREAMRQGPGGSGGRSGGPAEGGAPVLPRGNDVASPRPDPNAPPKPPTVVPRSQQVADYTDPEPSHVVVSRSDFDAPRQAPAMDTLSGLADPGEPGALGFDVVSFGQRPDPAPVQRRAPTMDTLSGLADPGEPGALGFDVVSLGKRDAPGAATITGSNVREGTEMPAEAGASPAPTPPADQSQQQDKVQAGDWVEYLDSYGKQQRGRVQDVFVKAKFVPGQGAGQPTTHYMVTDAAGNYLPEPGPNATVTKIEAPPADQTAEPDPAPDVPPTAPEATPEPPGGHSLVSAVSELARMIRAGSVTKAQASKLMESVYGGTMAQGKFTSKDMTDAIEMAVNRIVLMAPSHNWMHASLEGAAANLGRIRQLLERVPTQTTRTPEMDQLQQFSTPPTHGYVAGWVANIVPGEVVLEPSAGVGGLAAFASQAGAYVIANELSPRRADLLRQSGAANEVLVENAEHLHAIMTPGIESGAMRRPTLVIMNPPFSNAARSNDKNTMVGARHVEEAMKLLAPGGRLVAIVGEGMALDRPRFKEWWRKMAGQYRVLANVGLPGEEYRKYGTSFGNQLLVIDKVPPRQEVPVGGKVARLEELFTLLEKVRNERPDAQTRRPTQPGPAEPGGSAPTAPGSGGGASGGVAPADPGGRRPGPRRGQRPRPPKQTPANPGELGAGNGPATGGVAPPAGGAGPAGGGGGGAVGSGGSGVENAGGQQPRPGGGRPLDPRLGSLYDALRAKLGGGKTQPASAAGPRIDPEALTIAGQIAEIHVENGVSTFRKFAEAVLVDVPDLWDRVKPYLYPAWNAAATANPEIEELTRSQAAGILEAMENLPEVSDTPNPTPPPHPTQADRNVGLTVEKAVAGQQQLNESGVFSKYTPRKLRIAGAKPHPTPLVEPTAMAAVDPVDPTYQPHLPTDKIAAGFPSLTQLEQVVYAGQAHGRMLPNGTRMGYFIGDGTGVGKGVTIASIILDNWNRGRQKAVWVSAKGDLIKDAKRDFADLGFDLTKIVDVKANGGRVLEGLGAGVAFVPYTSLRQENPGIDPKTVEGGRPKLYPPGSGKPSKKAAAGAGAPGSKAKPSRMHRLYDWLGPDFDGVIVFDEAHKAGNAVDIKGSRGVEKASQTAKVVLDIQRLFPQARIVYASATGATEVSNLAYADRLGIWGEGTSFSTKQQFIAAIQAGGLSAMEIVARDLKAMGRYLARTLSFEGVDQRQLQHVLTPEQRQVYDELAGGWQTVINAVGDSLAQTGASNHGPALAAANSALWGAQQRFYNQLLTAMQLPSVLADMRQQLDAGNACVLQLVNTNEATLGRELAEKGSEAVDDDTNYLEDLDLSPKDLLLQYVDTSFPVQKYELVVDQEGNEKWEPVRDADGNPVADPEAVAAKLALMDKLAMLRVPANPLEQILDTFGHENVAEITGRTRRVVLKRQPDGTVKRVLETGRGVAHRQAEAEDFNNDKRRILIFSGAGGTGFTFSSNRRFKNQRRREHYLVQAGWRADEAVQGFGRTHRSDQVNAPEYILVSTDLSGHKRFIATIARRLEELGALTGGERKAAGSQIFNEDDNLEDGYAEDAVEAFFLDLFRNEVEGMNFADLSRKLGYVRKIRDDHTGTIKEILTLIDSKTGGLNRTKIPTVQQFLNRILSLPFETQNRVFDAFAERRKRRIASAKSDGSYDPGTQTVKALAIRKQAEETVWQSKENTAETKLVTVEVDQPVHVYGFPGMTPRKGEAYIRNVKSGRVYYVEPSVNRTKQDGSIVEMYSKVGPTTADHVERQEVMNGLRDYRLEVIEPPDARRLWESEAAQAPKVRAYQHTYLTGAMLPIWDRIGIGNPKVWRLTTTAGETFLGVLIPPEALPELRARLGAGMGVAASPEAVFRDIIEHGRRVQLSNGWVLARVRVAGEYRIEVSGVSHSDMQAGLFGNRTGDPGPYGYTERIAWTPRFFVPTDEAAGIAAITKILEKAPQVTGTADVVEASLQAARGGPTGELASRGVHVKGFAVRPGQLPPAVVLGGMQHVRPIEMPELVRLAHDLLGGTIRLKKPRGKAIGMFRSGGGQGMIQLDPTLFANPVEAAQVLAHEIGHAYDWFDDRTGTARGNLWGHLAALATYMRATFGQSAVTSKELKAELIALSEWWRPYDKTQVTQNFVDYRESPEELYADALSVLLNAPGVLEQRAPKFYAAFWEQIGQRPEASAKLHEIQQLLAGGQRGVLARREADLVAAFARGEELWRAAVEERRRLATTWDGWWTRMGQELYWEHYPMERRAAAVERRGVKLPLEKDPRVFLDDWGFRDVEVMRWGRMIYERVIAPIEAAGITLEDAGKLLFFDRIEKGDRMGLANPGGITPKQARMGRLAMNLRLGLPRMTLLREALDRFHAEVFALAREAVEVGAYNRRTFLKTIAPNRDHYAAFAVLDYLQDYVPAAIHEQVGTLRDVANPLHATILKAISMIHVIARQRAVNGTVEFLGTHFPGEIERVGNTEPSNRPGRGVLRRLEDGRPVYYRVDPYIADAFAKGNTRQLWWLTRVADGLFRQFIYPLIITYNPAFLYVMSPMRDIQRTVRNLPGGVQAAAPTAKAVTSMAGMLKAFGLGGAFLGGAVGGPLGAAAGGMVGAAVGSALGSEAMLRSKGVAGQVAQRYAGTAGPIIREMEANLALGTPFDQLSRVHRDDFLGDLLRRMRVLPDHSQGGWWRDHLGKPVRWFFDRLELGGMTLDALAKVAGYQHLVRRGVNRREAGVIIRNAAGLPNINKKGLLVRQLRALIPFWNVAMQGLRADAKIATDPKTASGWWFKYAATNGALRAVLALGAAGALGSVIKELFAALSDYNKTNFLTIPVGTTGGGDYGQRVVAVRIPEDETARILGGLISLGIRSLGPDSPALSSLFDFGMGQVPSLNPAVTVPMKWAQFAAGQNPVDPFTGQEIIGRDEWAAGKWPAVMDMGAWTLRQAGLMNFFRYDPKAETTWELALSAAPGFNRFVTVTDHGYRERQQADMDEAAAARAMGRLSWPKPVRSLALEVGRLERLAKERTLEQERRYQQLRPWYNKVYSPGWEALEKAMESGNKDAAAAIRRNLEQSTETLFRK